MAKQDCRHCGPEEFREAKHANGLIIAQLRWSNSGIGMPGERHLKTVFYRDLYDGMHTQGGQRKYYKDTRKATLRIKETERVLQPGFMHPSNSEWKLQN